MFSFHFSCSTLISTHNNVGQICFSCFAFALLLEDVVLWGWRGTGCIANSLCSLVICLRSIDFHATLRLLIQWMRWTYLLPQYSFYSPPTNLIMPFLSALIHMQNNRQSVSGPHSETHTHTDMTMWAHAPIHALLNCIDTHKGTKSHSLCISIPLPKRWH